MRWLAALPLALFAWGLVGRAGVKPHGDPSDASYYFTQFAAFGVGALVMHLVVPAGHRRAAACVWAAVMACGYVGMLYVLGEIGGAPGKGLEGRMVTMIAACVVYGAYQLWSSRPRPDAS